ncbi:MAG: hypothetical protein ACO1OO_13020 [Flavisolibacter sp.]
MNPAAPESSRFTQALGKFKPIQFDTLRVNSSYRLDKEDYPFKGVPLDSLEAALFPSEIASRVTKYDQMYACYRFPMGDGFAGLIARVPSTYESSSIQLFILDKAKDNIVNYFELAEIFGDAGDFAEKVSWLIWAENELRNFSWYYEAHDYSVEDEGDNRFEEFNNFSLVQINKGSVDTLAKDSAALIPSFGAYIQKYRQEKKSRRMSASSFYISAQVPTFFSLLPIHPPAQIASPG